MSNLNNMKIRLDSLGRWKVNEDGQNFIRLSSQEMVHRNVKFAPKGYRCIPEGSSIPTKQYKGEGRCFGYIQLHGDDFYLTH